MNGHPIRFGVVGISGYGATHVRGIMALKESGKGVLTSAVVRNPSKYPEKVEPLAKEGVKFYRSLPEMLEAGGKDIDIVAIPSGIDSHEEMTIYSLNKGYNVLCEKPAAGTVQEIDNMIAAKNKTKKFVAIGFQSIYHPKTQELKSIITSGKLGTFKSSVMRNFAPRPISYYQRNSWAGKYKSGDRWILDSPFCNAMAHQTQLMQYLAGPTRETSANVVSINAELYRAKPIETFDTFSVRMELENGGTILSLGSHSCRDQYDYDARILLNFEKGSVIMDSTGIVIKENGNKTEWPDAKLQNARDFMFRNIAENHSSNKEPLCTLENSRSLTQCVNGAMESCPQPYDIPKDAIESYYSKKKSKNETDFVIAVKNIENILEKCFSEEKLISETGVPWAKKGVSFDLKDYHAFPVSEKLKSLS